MWILWPALFLMYAGFSLIVPFLPLYVRSMGVPHVEVWTGLVFSSTYLAAAVALPFWGAFADRRGRRLVMIRSVFAIATLITLMGFARSPWQLVGLRLLLGAAGGVFPAVTAYMTHITPAHETGYMLGIVYTANTAGHILGPFAGGVLAHFLGYRAIFFVTGGVCLAAGIVMWLYVREAYAPHTAGQRPHVLVDLRAVAAHPALLALMVVVMVQAFSLMTVEPVISLYLGTLGVPATVLSFLSGTVFSVVGVANLLVSPFLGRGGDRWGYRRMLLLSLGGVAIGYALQGLAANWWHLLAFRFVQGCFVGGVITSVHALISRQAPGAFRGRAFGIAASAQMAGNFFGPLAGGAVAAGLGYRFVFPFTALIVVANLVWVWLGAPRLRSRPHPTESGHSDPPPG